MAHLAGARAKGDECQAAGLDEAGEHGLLGHLCLDLDLGLRLKVWGLGFRGLGV